MCLCAIKSLFTCSLICNLSNFFVWLFSMLYRLLSILVQLEDFVGAEFYSLHILVN